MSHAVFCGVLRPSSVGWHAGLSCCILWCTQAIQCGVDYRDHGGRTPLMYAVLGNQPRMCDTLLGLGAKVNTQDSAGLSPLLWATFQAKPQCMKILLR